MRLLVEQKHGVTLVPSAVIQRTTSSTYVYVVKPDRTVTVRQITVGVTEGDDTEITSGLAPGDVLVMTGVDKLQEGTQVNVQMADQQAARRRQGRREAEVSPSRTFILRPVATSLLMVGILLAGGVAYKQLPVSALPEVDYPTIQVITFYPGASPGRDGVLGHRAARAPVRPGARPAADDLHQLRRQLGHHPAIQPQPEHRRRRAGSAAVHQRLRNVSARRSSRSRRSTARPIPPIRRF